MKNVEYTGEAERWTEIKTVLTGKRMSLPGTDEHKSLFVSFNINSDNECPV